MNAPKNRRKTLAELASEPLTFVPYREDPATERIRIARKELNLARLRLGLQIVEIVALITIAIVLASGCGAPVADCGDAGIPSTLQTTAWVVTTETGEELPCDLPSRVVTAPGEVPFPSFEGCSRQLELTCSGAMVEVDCPDGRRVTGDVIVTAENSAEAFVTFEGPGCETAVDLRLIGLP